MKRNFPIGQPSEKTKPVFNTGPGKPLMYV